MRGKLLLLLIACSPGLALAQPAPSPLFRLYLEEPGVYRVTWDELVAAGLGEKPRPSARIGLESFGTAVPIEVDDGGDKKFGPGDSIVFLGDRLRGEYSYLDEYSRFNCYELRFDVASPARFAPMAAPSAQGRDTAALRSTYHIERDLLMLRFPEQPNAREETWYWAKLTHLDREPFEQVLDLHDLQGEAMGADLLAAALRVAARRGHQTNVPGAEVQRGLDQVFGGAETVTLTLGVRGWSMPRTKADREIKDHAVEVLLNGARVGLDEWNGRDHHRVTLELPASAFLHGDNRVGVRVPPRTIGKDSTEALIDIVMVNWVEVSYPLSPEVGPAQVTFTLDDEHGGQKVDLVSTTREPLRVYTTGGRRFAATAGADGGATFAAPDEPMTYWASTRAGMRQVDHVVLDRPSRLREVDQQVDYIMISHNSLMEAVEPLAEMHRRRGLAVSVVDVQDVFDEFNHGVVNPRALKDFLSFAYHSWQPPAPRFVLLVGDASWDYKNTVANDAQYADWTYRPGETTHFVKNSSIPYAEGSELNRRNLVPTWPYGTYQGHAASDTYLACVDGDDDLPDLAIGRFPVLSPEEVEAIVAKTIAYVERPEVGPWRRNMLFIANEDSGFQRRTESTADEFQAKGFAPFKVYPPDKLSVTDEHSLGIVNALDTGVNIVHFLGHGGRYIWRTGPPDLKLNRDLFTLDHLDTLQPTRRLPVVISLTCYSAPFDHPTADSIGEKFLRVADRGAIAVVAASWRNSPSPTMGKLLIEELMTPGATIGEAVTRAKREIKQPVLVQTYNLLGDPAVPVAAPGEVDVDLHESPHHLVLRARANLGDFSGRGLVEWVDQDGKVAFSEAFELSRPSLTGGLVPGRLGPGTQVLGARVYMWDEARGVDAVGWAGVNPPPSSQAASTAQAQPAPPPEAGVENGSSGEVS